MKKSLLILFSLLFISNAYTQIVFEKAYFTDNAGVKTDCLIKNVDWENNPTEFEYMLTEGGTPKNITIEDVQEFKVLEGAKYRRAKVNIDRSSNILGRLTENKNPVFKEETLFLKVIVEGEANLYDYTTGSVKRFFYQMGDKKIEQLIYKRYLSKDGNIGNNNRFRQQLTNNLKCASITKSSIKSTTYQLKSLVKLFINYHNCKNIPFVNFAKEKKRDFFNLTIRPGLSYSSLNVDISAWAREQYDFGNELGFRLGLDAEIILPFNKNKWAGIFEPTYQSYKGSKGDDFKTWEVDYQSLELSIGFRHYIFLNDKSKIFLNAVIVLDIEKETKVIFTPGQDLDIDTNPSFAFGGGYKFNDKMSVEFRAYTRRDLLGRYSGATGAYAPLSLILGYSFL